MFSLFKPFNLGDLADEVLPTLHVPLIVYTGFLSEEQKDWTGCSLSHCHVLFCGELRDNNKSPKETWCQGSTAELPNLTTLMYTACFYLSACFLGGDYSVALGRCCAKNLVPGLFAPQKTKSKEKVYHRTFYGAAWKHNTLGAERQHCPFCGFGSVNYSYFIPIWAIAFSFVLFIVLSNIIGIFQDSLGTPPIHNHCYLTFKPNEIWASCLLWICIL